MKRTSGVMGLLLVALFLVFAGLPRSVALAADTTQPTGTIIINNNRSATNTPNVTLALTWSDGAGSGVSRMRFSNDGATWSAWEVLQATRPYTLPGGDGHKTVRVQYLDKANNRSAIYNDYIRLDTTPPTGAIIIDDGASTTASLEVTLGLFWGDAGAGVSRMRFSDDGAHWTAWMPPTATHTHTLPDGLGYHTVRVQYLDGANNYSNVYNDFIKVVSVNSSDYFVSTPGFGIEYRVTDTQSAFDEHVWALFQDGDNSNDFVMTLNGTTLDNSLAGEFALSWNGGNYLSLNHGYPCGNQGNFFMSGFMLPTEFLFGDAWSFVGTAEYSVEDQGPVTVGGETFPDCIKINVDDPTNSSSYLRGSGYLLVARNVGVIQLSFDRSADGTHVAYDYVSRGNYAKHTLSGTVTVGGVAAAGKIVQIHNASWGTRAVTDVLGQFSIAAYGPEIVLRFGDDANHDGTFDFAAGWPKEYPVHTITSDRTVTVAF